MPRIQQIILLFFFPSSPAGLAFATETFFFPRYLEVAALVNEGQVYKTKSAAPAAAKSAAPRPALTEAALPFLASAVLTAPVVPVNVPIPMDPAPAEAPWSGTEAKDWEKTTGSQVV